MFTDLMQSIIEICSHQSESFIIAEDGLFSHPDAVHNLNEQQTGVPADLGEE